jgi:hypothetical protein
MISETTTDNETIISKIPSYLYNSISTLGGKTFSFLLPVFLGELLVIEWCLVTVRQT